MDFNPYKILAVDPSADLEVINAAYRALSKKYHPDTNRKTDATNRMQEINKAYGILKNPEQRKLLDIELLKEAEIPNSSSAIELKKDLKNFTDEDRWQMLGDAVEGIGRMISSVVTETVKKENIPNIPIEELAYSFVGWLRPKDKGTIDVKSFLHPFDCTVIALEEKAFFGSRYLFVFANLPNLHIINKFKKLEFEGKRYAALVIVSQQCFLPRNDFEKELSLFVWQEGLRLGKDGAASDYVAEWIIYYTHYQFKKE